MKTATTIPVPVRHIYQADTSKQYKEVRHYIITNVVNDILQLYELLNVSKDRQFSKAKNIAYWLKGKNTDTRKWSRPITGLKPTSTPNVYFGDIATKQNGRFIPKDLLIFRFAKDAETLIIYVYRNFYTEQPTALQKLIKTGLK